MRKVPVTEAVGMVLGHDITRIIPGREKTRAFQKGHVIRESDIDALLNLGKEHIYVWEPEENMVHEDEAALRLAGAAAGRGLTMDGPNQGKVALKATDKGLLKVDIDRLNSVNSIEDMVFSTLHNNRVVEAGQTVAGTRVTPLAVPADKLEEAEKICRQHESLIYVKPFNPLWVAVVTTGNEVYSGRIQDASLGMIRSKVTSYGGRVMGQSIVPDDQDLITQEIRRFIAEGAELVLTSGGMSVDPDDVTPPGIRATGAEVVFYGAPVLPGSMFMLAYLGHVPICGLPGCVMYNRTTILDLLLPRFFAGERVSRADVVAMGHGGLCEECEVCRYPSCSFGKSNGL